MFILFKYNINIAVASVRFSFPIIINRHILVNETNTEDASINNVLQCYNCNNLLDFGGRIVVFPNIGGHLIKENYR